MSERRGFRRALKAFQITAPFAMMMLVILAVVFSVAYGGLVALQARMRANLVRGFGDNYAQFLALQTSRLIGERADSSDWEADAAQIARALIKRSPVSGLSGIILTNKSGAILEKIPRETQCQVESVDGTVPIVLNNETLGYVNVCADLTGHAQTNRAIDLITIGALTSRIGADYGRLVASQFELMLNQIEDPEYWDLASGPISYSLNNLMNLYGVQSIGVFNKSGDIVVWEHSKNNELVPILTAQAPILFKGSIYGRVSVDIDLPEVREVEAKFRLFLIVGAGLAMLILFTFPLVVVRRLEGAARRAYNDLRTSHSQLQDAQMQLVNSAKMAALGTMASGIGHEINNPLTIIIGHARILTNKAESGKLEAAEAGVMGNKIIQTAFRIAKIVKSLRTFARDGRRDPFTFNKLKSILDETLEICRERATTNGVVIHAPEIPEELEIECQSVQVGQVILNLINNSCDAVEGLSAKWVKIEFADQGVEILLTVTDSGSGIPEEVRANLFVPFVTTKPPGKGTGLGLSLSRQIIESHGGSLILDTTHANTRFVIRLLKKQPPVAVVETKSSAIPPQAA